MLDVAIWQTARLRNDLGRAVTAQLQVMSKLDLLSTLLSQTRPNLAAQFTPVAEYVRQCLNGKRNTVAHGMWFTSPNEPIARVVKFSARGQLVLQGGPMELKELHQLAHDIANVASWLIDLCEFLPKLKTRRGGLGHRPPSTQNLQDCATRKQRALQPPSLRRKAPPPQPRKRQRSRKKGDVRN